MAVSIEPGRQCKVMTLSGKDPPKFGWADYRADVEYSFIRNLATRNWDQPASHSGT